MCKQRMAMNLLVVEFLGLSRLKELQEIPQCSLIVVSERIPWTIPVPGHHTTRQGGGRWREEKIDGRRRGGKQKGEKDSEEAHRRQKEGGRRSQRRRSKGKQQTEVGGTCYSTFLLTSADDHSFSVFHYYLPRNGVNNHFNNNNNNNWQKTLYSISIQQQQQQRATAVDLCVDETSFLPLWLEELQQHWIRVQPLCYRLGHLLNTRDDGDVYTWQNGNWAAVKYNLEHISTWK